MLTLTCQLTYPDACGAAGAWTRVFVVSVGLIPISLKLHDPEVHHDDAGHRPLHRHRQPDPRRARRRTPVDHHRMERRPRERRPPAGARAPDLQGTNAVPQFDAIVSCQTISAAGAATVTNVSTAAFPASAVGNADINATVSLPHPCIAPIVFVASPVFGWFAGTGGVEARASSPRRGRAGSPQAGPVPSRRRPLCGTSAVPLVVVRGVSLLVPGCSGGSGRRPG